MPSEKRSQQRVHTVRIDSHKILGNANKSIMIESRSVVAQKGWRFGKNRLEKLQKGVRKPLGWWICLLSWLWWWFHSSRTYIKTYCIIQFQYVQFILCQLYPSVFKKEFKKESSCWFCKNEVECFAISQWYRFLFKKCYQFRWKGNKYSRLDVLCGNGGRWVEFIKIQKEDVLRLLCNCLKVIFLLEKQWFWIKENAFI